MIENQARGFRAPLDIDEYVQRLGGGGARALGYRQSVKTPTMHDDVPEVSAAPRRPDDPYKVGSGPAECSSSTELVRTPEVIWDVNGYYRSLGFEFPYTGVTRKAIRIAALALDSSSSVRLTFVVNQLLDRYVRYDYDRMPLGETYMDGWIEHELKQQAKRTAAQRSAEQGEPVDFEKILEEWGAAALSEEELAEIERMKAEDQQRKALAAKWGWGWSYYLWRSRKYDPEVLREWQSLLISEFSRAGARVKFCVGFLGEQPHPWVSVVVGSRLAILLNEAEAPTTELATKAVAAVLAEHNTTDN